MNKRDITKKVQASAARRKIQLEPTELSTIVDRLTGYAPSTMEKKMTEAFRSIITTRQRVIARSTIYNTSIKTKAQIRAESDAALELFLKSGGVIQEGRKTKNKRGSRMASKNTRYVSGSSGFAAGYPKKGIFA